MGWETELRDAVVAQGRAGAPPACMRRLARALGRVRPRVTRAVPVVSVVVRGEAGPGALSAVLASSHPARRGARRGRGTAGEPAGVAAPALGLPGCGRRRGDRHVPGVRLARRGGASRRVAGDGRGPGGDRRSDLALGDRRGPEVRPWVAGADGPSAAPAGRRQPAVGDRGPHPRREDVPDLLVAGVGCESRCRRRGRAGGAGRPARCDDVRRAAAGGQRATGERRDRADRRTAPLPARARRRPGRRAPRGRRGGAAGVA